MTDETAPAYSGPARVLSGVQPSGALHLGNYLGAIKKFVDLQHQMQCLFCVVDLHAITAWQDPAQLTAQTREIAAAYLAAGVDPRIAIVFPQSAVAAHAELAWILQCVARVGWLDRMTQFKEKSGKHKERASVGLYTYPVLQAADILVYKATHVPVGEDQKQHLELARDIAQKFNHDFEAPGFFPLPEPLPESVEGLEGRPEADNLVGLFAALSGRTKAQVLADYAGQGFGQSFKPALTEVIVGALAPISAEMRRYAADPAEIDRVLAAGAEKARSFADPVIEETKGLVGFWRAKA